MHAAILFYNIGGYHAARLRSANEICQKMGWQFTAIQEIDKAQEHPWGDIAKEITFPLKTLLHGQEATHTQSTKNQSTVAASRLSDCLESTKPDVLIIPGWGCPVSRMALKWAKRHNLPTVLMSESKWNDSPRSWWKEKIKSLLFIRHFDAALVGGQLHQDYLVKLGVAKKSIFPGYDVVDNDYFTTRSQQAKKDHHLVRQQHPEIPTRPYFIAVSRFIPRKNLTRLVDAYAQYRKTVPPSDAWDLVICGSGVEEQTIKTRIAHHHLESSIHLPGFRSYEEMPYWFGLASAFIHPALSEQWGLVVNEALASGLPSLVSDRCGCFSELIHEGENGFGFDPTNAEQLSQLMKKVSQDDAQLASMKQSALHHIQAFSPTAFGNGFKQAIEKAIYKESV